jgi:hypothetical protein
MARLVNMMLMINCWQHRSSHGWRIAFEAAMAPGLTFRVGQLLEGWTADLQGLSNEESWLCSRQASAGCSLIKRRGHLVFICFTCLHTPVSTITNFTWCQREI